MHEPNSCKGSLRSLWGKYLWQLHQDPCDVICVLASLGYVLGWPGKSLSLNNRREIKQERQKVCLGGMKFWILA